jgi:small subunit ribosomal protein S13
LNFAYLTIQEYKHIVRVVGNDIPGDKPILIGLTQIRGVGYNFANAILNELKIKPNTNIGFLSDLQVETIEKILKNLSEAKFPSWFLNRQKDIETGKDLHLITSTIEFTVRNDIEREKTTNSWRGYRHTFGLKVRGQRTRTTGRKGGAVGVAKGGKIMPATGEAAAQAAEAVAETVEPPTAEKKGAAPAEKKGAAPAEKKEATKGKKE